MTRRDFLCTATKAALVGGALASTSRGAADRSPEARFFTVAKRNGRWWFITPAGEPFFALALNHIDPAPLRYQENGDLWQRKYGNRMERWLKEAVRPDLLDWGFNSVGWVQEVVTRGPTNHRHSRGFTFEEYQWLDLPYCHLLPFADFHQWEMETRHPDFFSQEFADWCDYVAREHCARMATDPKLIGYFYIDCPTWVHVRPGNQWKGPLFDPEKLKTAAGKTELGKLATRYYQVTHDAIRRYDKHHLILGDRYEARAPLPEEVVRAALPFVDVLSFQDFGPVAKIAENFRKWAAVADKPVILADSAGQIPASEGYSRQDPKKYRDTLVALREIPTCIGFHLCGAYLRNNVRKRALRDAQERPDTEAIRAIKEANAQTTAWARQAGQSK